MPGSEDADIEIWFKTNADIVNKSIDSVRDSTQRAEFAASGFNRVQKEGHALAEGGIRSLKGLGEAARIAGISSGGAAIHLERFFHTAMMLGGAGGIGIAAGIAVIGYAYESMAKSAEVAAEKTKKLQESLDKSRSDFKSGVNDLSKDTEGIAGGLGNKFRQAEFRGQGSTAFGLAADHKTLGISTVLDLLNAGAKQTDKRDDFKTAELFRKIGIDPVKAFERISEARTVNKNLTDEQEFRIGEGYKTGLGLHMSAKDRTENDRLSLGDLEKAKALSEEKFKSFDIADIQANSKAFADLSDIVSGRLNKALEQATFYLEDLSKKMSTLNADKNRVRVQSIQGGIPVGPG